MRSTNTPGLLDEEKFIELINEGFDLFATYEYTKDDRSYWIRYNVFMLEPRISSDGSEWRKYVLTIEESEKNFDVNLDDCSERDARIQFYSLKKLLDYFKKHEHFAVNDWVVGDRLPWTKKEVRGSDLRKNTKC